MPDNQSIYIPRRPSTLNVTIGLILALLVIAAVRGVDLQHWFIRAVWPMLGHDRATEVSLHFTAPAKSIAEVTLNTPLFGWPACLVLLATLGTRKRYRRIKPVILFTLVSMFGYFAIIFTHDTLMHSYGITPGWLSRSRTLPKVLAITGCNLALAFIAWRWTRSRVMLCGLLALAMFSPIQRVAEREVFYFTRFHTAGINNIPPSEIPSQFEQWLGPSLSDTWAASFVQWAMSYDGPLYRELPITITTETYTDIGPNGHVTKTYPRVVVFVNYIFGIGYNAAILLLALWVVFFNRWGRPGQCTSCSYDLAGLEPGTPCPECGTAPPSTITDAQ